MSKMIVAGLDPAMNNTGVAIGSIDLETADWSLTDLMLIQPPKLDKASAKVVRVSSNDLARARHTHEQVVHMLKQHGVQMVFAEVPTGCQSARGSLGNGTAIMLLASLPVTMIEVTPTQVKLAVGDKYAAKEKMIEWATTRWPDLPWLRKKSKAGVGSLIGDNEHLADACGAVAAGLRTQDFRHAFTLTRQLYANKHLLAA